MKKALGLTLAASGCFSDLGYDAVKNTGGSWTREELRQSANIFNRSSDLATRQKMLHRFLSAKYILLVEIDGIGTYAPERISDTSYLEKFERKISLQGATLVAYNPPLSFLREQDRTVNFSPDKRTWKTPLETVQKIVLKKNRLLSLLITKS